MFLKELSQNEAFAFLGLVQSLAKIDEVFSEKEKDLLKEYYAELSLSKDTKELLSFSEAIKKLENSSIRIKNIVYFELLGLALIDGLFEEKEIEFLDKLAHLFQIGYEEKSRYLYFFKKVKDMYDIAFLSYEDKIKALEKEAYSMLPQ